MANNDSQEEETAYENALLLGEAGRIGSKLFKCAYELERQDYSVVHIDKEPETGILLEAHGSPPTWENCKIIQIGGGACHFDGSEYDSVSSACDALLHQLAVS